MSLPCVGLASPIRMDFRGANELNHERIITIFVLLLMTVLIFAIYALAVLSVQP